MHFVNINNNYGLIILQIYLYKQQLEILIVKLLIYV